MAEGCDISMEPDHYTLVLLVNLSVSLERYFALCLKKSRDLHSRQPRVDFGNSGDTRDSQPTVECGRGQSCIHESLPS